MALCCKNLRFVGKSASQLAAMGYAAGTPVEQQAELQQLQAIHADLMGDVSGTVQRSLLKQLCLGNFGDRLRWSQYK